MICVQQWILLLTFSSFSSLLFHYSSLASCKSSLHAYLANKRHNATEICKHLAYDERKHSTIQDMTSSAKYWPVPDRMLCTFDIHKSQVLTSNTRQNIEYRKAEATLYCQVRGTRNNVVRKVCAIFLRLFGPTSNTFD